MRVLLAEAMGMCFGVRDALAVMRRVAEPTRVTVRGELVHNPIVQRELGWRGFVVQEEGMDMLPKTAEVLITAHGVSDAERERLIAAGKQIIDTTCPLVRRAHAAALELQAKGYFVVVLGKPGHAEVRGLTGDLAAYEVIERITDVRRWAHERIGILAQTTAMEDESLAMVHRIRCLNPHAEVEFVNTICQPTRDRQAALEQLLREVNVLVVVGGRNSNNTQHLVHLAEERGVRAIHIVDACELWESQFSATEIVGVTAGTSTLPETIEQVKKKLLSFWTLAAV